jgi:transposase
MDINNILADLKRERDRLNSAIAALEGSGQRRRGRPAGSGSAGASAHAGRRPRRHMSAAARKRISDMMKQRWAERKRKSKG